MNLRALLDTIGRGPFLVKNRGLRYTYNHYYNLLHFQLYSSKNPLLVKLLYWLEPYPSYLEVEATTRCNLKCIMCEHTYWNEPARDLSFEEFKGLIDQFLGLKWIAFTGIGENFLNKDFMKMYRYLKSKWKGILIELYDTFYFIDEKIARELIQEIGLTRVLASIDGATKGTYEKIRVGSNFERVTSNVKRFIEIKRELSSPLPEIIFHYIISKANIHEVPQYVEYVKSLGGEDIFFTAMLHSFEEVKELVTEVPKEVIREAEKRGKELGVHITWNEDVPEQKPPISKCTEWTMPFIYVTGHVQPCCAAQEANRRPVQKEQSLGNVFEKSFKEIWNSGKYRNLRRMLAKGKVPAQCRDCPIYDTGRGRS